MIGISIPRSLGVVDLLVAGQAHPDPHRGDDLEPGIEGVDGDVEPDLVVALAGAAVGDRVGALAAGDLDEELGDQRPGQRGRQRIGALVQRVRLEVRPDEVADEPLLGVDDVGPRRAGADRPPLDALAERAAADVDRQGHDLAAVLLAEPGDGDGRIEPARVGEDDLLHGMRASMGAGADGVEAVAPGEEARFVGEQDEERVVARERALLLGERGLVDRLGDDAGGARRAGDEQDQPAPADRDRDVGEDPAEPLVGPGAAGAGPGSWPTAPERLRGDVDVARGARRP